MIKSMTGYGRARETRNKRDITVEVRSVNNRYLDCTVKMPRMYAFAEDAVKKHVQQAVSRGKVDVFITVDATAADVSKVEVNRELAAQYAADQGYTRVGIVYCSADTYSSGLRDAFSAACAEKGIEVVAEESVATMTEVDYTNQFNQMVSAGAELVFTPFYYDVMGPYLIPQARSVGFDGVLLGADGVDNTETTIPDGADLSAYNNVMFVNHYSTDLATSDVSLSFIESYEAKYGESPNNFDALAYDAVYVLVSAMEDAGAADAASVQASLADTSKVYEVSTGTFSFDDTGTPIKSGVLMGYQYDEATDSVQKISIETLSVD